MFLMHVQWGLITLMLVNETITFSYLSEDDEYRIFAKRALQKSHEKTISEKRMDVFFSEAYKSAKEATLVGLVNSIALRYLDGCTSVILYDGFTENNDLLLEQLLKSYPLSYSHGQISDSYKVVSKQLLVKKYSCVSYLLFLEDVVHCKELIGEQNIDKVLVIARSSQWRVYEFLGSKISQSFVNLLVIAQSAKTTLGEEMQYILFTHKLYVDALGSSEHQVLTSWKNNSFTRPNVNLFPNKVEEGFAGHRFIIALAHQPPFVIKKGTDENDDVQWDGTEIRLVKLLAEIYNFTIEFKEAPFVRSLGSAEAVTKVMKRKEAHLGLAGLYITQERINIFEMSVIHTQDCAAFISLTSTALPRYRAIMGPFHWTVWVALVFVYLFAIFPLSFSDKHTLKPLLANPEEIENMFWYVFGTFTNAFSFAGKQSWSHSNKIATRLFIGFYWIFTIIITACYTGSIIAFVTLPIFPDTVDTPQQLISGRYRIGTLDKGGWQYWFENATDPITAKLLKNVDLVATVEEGLKNTTKAFFWSYAFLGSKAQLDYIVRTNFTTTSKRSLLHISNKCFVPFSVGITMQKNTIHSHVINEGILRILQTGLMIKSKNDVEWYTMRSATGKLLSATTASSSLNKLSYEDRALTLDDTQGMFLLLTLGFILGGASLLSEWLGGCFKFCKRRTKRGSNSSIPSNPRSYNGTTPRDKINSIQYNINDDQMKNDSTTLLYNVEAFDIRNHIEHNFIGQSPRESEGVDRIIVHAPQGESVQERTVNEEIDDMFDFAHIFGEETNKPADDNFEEEIIEKEEDDKNTLESFVHLRKRK